MNAMRVGKGNGNASSEGEVLERDMLTCFFTIMKLCGSEKRGTFIQI